MAAARVLVVEDDDGVRRFESRVLRGLGHEVAANAWQALFHLQEAFDLVILDIGMPSSISGDQLINTLRTLEKEVPVIVFSGFVDDLDDDLPDFVRAVLRKPVGLQEFVGTIIQYWGTAEVCSLLNTRRRNLSLDHLCYTACSFVVEPDEVDPAMLLCLVERADLCATTVVT